MTQLFHFWEFIWRNWNTNLEDYTHPYVHSSIIYNSQDLEAAQVSISRWVDKKAVVHLHNGMWNTIPLEYYAAVKKKEFLSLATAWMYLEIIMLSEVSQRKTSTVWFHLYVESSEQN